MYTADDLVVLKEALVSGASQVTIGNRTIIFRTVDQLLQLIKIVQDDLNNQAGVDDCSSSTVIAGFDRKGR